MSFLSILEKAELEEKLNQDAKNWKKAREKVVQNIPFVIDVNPEKSRRKDQAQYEMYRDSYYSGY